MRKLSKKLLSKRTLDKALSEFKRDWYFYLVVIMGLYLPMNIKSAWVIDGKYKRCTSRDNNQI